MIGISLGLVARLNGGASGPRIVLSGASVDENAANGTSVATASINGMVTGTPAWSLTDASGTFQINSSTGAITVLSNTALDYETNTSLPITISVSGVTPAVNDRGQSIAINDVIETPVNTVAPVISGGTVEGDTLTVTSNGTWTDMGAGSFSYQWNNGVDIVGATSNTYTLQAGDVGDNVKCVVTATNSAGSAPANSNAIGPIAAAPSAPLAPSLDLSAASDTGSSATDNITSDNTPDIDVTFNTTPVAGDIIKFYDGATLIKTYTLTSDDVTNGTAALGITALADGSHSLTATHERSGLVSAASSALSITIDTVAPVLSSASGAQNGTTDTQADLSVTTNTGEGAIWWVVTTNSSTPTADQVKLGKDASGSAAASSGSTSVASTGAKTASATGLSTNTYYAYFVQTDVAGNTSAVASASWSQTVASFSPHAVNFDGATYLTGATSGMTDGYKGVCSFWYKPNANPSTVNFDIFIGRKAGQVRHWLRHNVNGKMELLFRDSTATQRLQIITTNVTADGNWHHLAFAWDTSAATAQVYIDGASALYSSVKDGSAALVYSLDTITHGASAGSEFLNGQLCELYMDLHETLDLSVAANLQKFRSAAGHPVSLGANGSTPTGTQPEIYLGGTHDYTNWGTNNGTAGNFTITAGALTSATAP